MTRARPGLRALTWIARADGPLDQDDADVMVEYVAERSRLGGRDATDFDRDIARHTILDDRATFDVAERAVAGMRRGGAEWRLVCRFAERIAALDPMGARDGRRARLMG